MGVLDSPAADLIPATFDTTYQHTIGFMITTDATLGIEMASGKYRIYPPGTFTTKTVYYIEPMRVHTDGTGTGMSGSVFFLTTRRQ